MTTARHPGGLVLLAETYCAMTLYSDLRWIGHAIAGGNKHVPGACWICGATADSREHRFKASDLTAAFGKGPYKGEDEVVHVGQRVIKKVQGYKADSLKYPPSLCSKCNNQRTQPFDRAYEAFTAWIWSNEETVLKKRHLNFREIYGENFASERDNLIRYFAKSFACRLHNDAHPIPADITISMGGRTLPRFLEISFSVNELIAKNKELLSSLHGKHCLWGSPAGARMPVYEWGESVSWLTTVIYYRRQIPLELGTVVSRSVESVALGSSNS